MIDKNTLDLFNHHPDIRVEFILKELQEIGLDPNDVVINALGIFKRRYGKDVVSGEIREYKDGKREYLHIDINRNGIYDLLPQGLFHQPQNRKSNLTTSQALEEYKLQKHIETESRLFFLPFEQELYRLALLLEAEERKSIFDVQNVLKNQEFINFWGIPDIFNERQICNLLYILPLAGFIAGNYPLTRLCFECILNDYVEIHESLPYNHQDIETEDIRLNSMELGVNFVIGNNYHEVASSLIISVHPSVEEDLIEYLEGGTKLKMVRFLSDYFLPFEEDFEISIRLNENFILKPESHHSRLGITTNL